VRGKAIYENSEKIIQSIEKKVKKGIKEIILLGQTVNAYKDNLSNFNFDKLLTEILKIKELKRLKFMSPHPLYFTQDFYKIFSENKKIARHIHLPVQSGSDKILKKMKRGYTISQYIEIVNKLREADNNTSISTDFIVGYPGETESDFIKTLELAENIKFSSAFCFKYSPRINNTENNNYISEEEKENRLNLLLKVVKKNSIEVLTSRIGKIEDVLIEKDNFGKSSTGFNCAIINKIERLEPGKIVKLEIKKIEKNILLGKVKND